MATPPKPFVMFPEYFDLGAKLENAIHTFDKYMDPSIGRGTITDTAAQEALQNINTAFAQMGSNLLSDFNKRLIRGIPLKLLRYAKDHSDHPTKVQLVQTIAITISPTPFLAEQFNVVYLSLTAAPIQPSQPDVAVATDWVEFAAHFYELMVPRITHALDQLIMQIPDTGDYQRITAIATTIPDQYADTDIPVSDDDRGKAKADDDQQPSLPAEMVLQLDTINETCCRFLEHYLHINPRDTLEIKTNLSRVAPLLFCSVPRLITRLEKRTILATLDRITLFFRDIDLLKAIPISSPEFITRFNALMKKRYHGNGTIEQQIKTKIQNILAFALLPDREQSGAIGAMSSISLILATDCILRFIELLIRPEVIPFFIQRLTLDKLKQIIERSKQNSEQTPPSDDHFFSQQAGRRLSELIKQFLSLGQSAGAAGLMIEALKKAIEGNASKIGKSMQQYLNGVTSARLILAPFYITDTLLFDFNDDGTATPILLRHLARSDREKEEFRALAQKQFYHLLHPLICTVVETYNSQNQESWVKRKAGKLGAKLISQDSTKAYCNSLANRLWQISQKPELVKILIFYVLNGISSAIIEEKEERASERHADYGVSTP